MVNAFSGKFLESIIKKYLIRNSLKVRCRRVFPLRSNVRVNVNGVDNANKCRHFTKGKSVEKSLSLFFYIN